jgi:hypothetical protein
VRILAKKTSEGWKVRFPFGNAWKMPAGQWLPVVATHTEASAHVVTAHLIGGFPGANVFVIWSIGEDLEQTDARAECN